MPRVCVVVPAYLVEQYIGETLSSIAGQTLRDFEVVVVDDGSPDRSAEIAHEMSERDPRFRVVSQPNGGLGRARNTGLIAGDSEFVMFVDSDDVLEPRALEVLSRSLDQTGADFATGAVLRLQGGRTAPAAFLRKAFLRSRPCTHVTRFPWLVSDRVAWNKLWRRSFIDHHRLRFAEGVFHEDIPMVVPAHFLARAVDVVATPVYQWRAREDGSRSITQRRLEQRVMLDRFAAVEHVCAFLADRELPAAAYHESVLAEDLLYHLDILDQADDEYRRVFLSRARLFLEHAGPDADRRLPAIQRLKWHLVRRGLLDELLEVLEFQRTGFKQRPTVRRGLHRYGAYPFLEDPALAVPRDVFRVDDTRRRAHQVTTVVRPARVRRPEHTPPQRPHRPVAVPGRITVTGS